MSQLLLSIVEAGEVLGVGRSTVYRLLDAGAFPAVTIGRRRLIAHDDLVAYVAALPRSAA